MNAKSKTDPLEQATAVYHAAVQATRAARDAERLDDSDRGRATTLRACIAEAESLIALNAADATLCEILAVASEACEALIAASAAEERPPTLDDPANVRAFADTALAWMRREDPMAAARQRVRAAWVACSTACGLLNARRKALRVPGYGIGGLPPEAAQAARAWLAERAAPPSGLIADKAALHRVEREAKQREREAAEAEAKAAHDAEQAERFEAREREGEARRVRERHAALLAAPPPGAEPRSKRDPIRANAAR